MTPDYLKADNLLVSFEAGPAAQQLMITDFWCSLAASEQGLCVFSWDTDRGGNAAFMALKIASLGKYSSLDYSKQISGQQAPVITQCCPAPAHHHPTL